MSEDLEIFDKMYQPKTIVAIPKWIHRACKEKFMSLRKLEEHMIQCNVRK